eukprot:CAMPEP_0198332290 /NCGR_PEP_ID=MMETSP1450-20131203/18178_1 /TAXON_ID=753684 ORGANISM="Madagascaria erythrocladiodes, Strain CCMP3234" /NCGR_SAMPLE_ID=MMETSP1450 /ASSEMBLY_ACC=CAM_ASM_001115 /LENGTH=137 /DNA_ID=CAMNT_0044036735 /DNA_START=55 /DNA_END=468 /DNA_ORIENTATION=+
MKSVSSIIVVVAMGLLPLVLAKQYKCAENSLIVNIENFENSDQFLMWGSDVHGAPGTKVKVVLDKPTFYGYALEPFISQWNVDYYHVSFNRKKVALTYNSVYNFGALLKKDSTYSDAKLVSLMYKAPGQPYRTCTLA